MNYIPLIRANIIDGFILFLEHHGTLVEHHLAATRLPPLKSRQSEILLPLKQVFQFYERVARAEGCDNLGFLVGQNTKIEDLGVFGRLLQYSATLYEAIQTSIHMIATYNSGDRIWLEEEGDRVWLCRKFVEELDVGRQYGEQHSIAIMINLIRLVAGSDWKPDAIRLEVQKSRHIEEIEMLSGTEIYFGQEATAIALSRSLLGLPLINVDTDDAIHVCSAYRQLYSSAPSTNFSGSIRQVIASQLQGSRLDIQLIAEILGISVRTLQRQLREANLTYSKLLQQVRFDQAVQLLNEPSVKLHDISIQLGYTDATNFTRAFRRWQGVSPSEFRNTYRGD